MNQSKMSSFFNVSSLAGNVFSTPVGQRIGNLCSFFFVSFALIQLRIDTPGRTQNVSMNVEACSENGDVVGGPELYAEKMIRIVGIGDDMCVNHHKFSVGRKHSLLRLKRGSKTSASPTHITRQRNSLMMSITKQRLFQYRPGRCQCRGCRSS